MTSLPSAEAPTTPTDAAEAAVDIVVAPPGEPVTDAVSPTSGEPATDAVSPPSDEPVTDVVASRSDEPAIEALASPSDELVTDAVATSDHVATEAVASPSDEPVADAVSDTVAPPDVVASNGALPSSGEAGEEAAATELASPPSDDGARAASGEGTRPARRPAAPRPAGARGIVRGDRAVSVPSPQHHHLPGWVRRDYARVRPALAEVLGTLHGEERATFLRQLDELTEGISSGKFSLAFQYPQLITEGRKLAATQREHNAEAQRLQRQLESARRQAGDRLREASVLLAPEAAARLNRALRQASDHGTIAEVEAEAGRALSTARSTQSRRRDREIERTRDRIRRTLPKAVDITEPQAETWQDVLRRFAEEQKSAAGAGASD